MRRSEIARASGVAVASQVAHEISEGDSQRAAMSLAVVMLGENQPASSSPRYLGSITVAWPLPSLLRETAGICAATSSSVRFCARRWPRTAWPKARAAGSGSDRRRGMSRKDIGKRRQNELDMSMVDGGLSLDRPFRSYHWHNDTRMADGNGVVRVPWIGIGRCLLHNPVQPDYARLYCVFVAGWHERGSERLLEPTNVRAAESCRSVALLSGPSGVGAWLPRGLPVVRRHMWPRMPSRSQVSAGLRGDANPAAAVSSA